MLDNLNLRIPVGSFVTLPPRYTRERNAVLKVLKPFWNEIIRFKVVSFDQLFGSFDCHWPDGGFRTYSSYMIHSPWDLHIVIDPHDEEKWAIRALTGIIDKNIRCPTCGKGPNKK